MPQNLWSTIDDEGKKKYKIDLKNLLSYDDDGDDDGGMTEYEICNLICLLTNPSFKVYIAIFRKKSSISGFTNKKKPCWRGKVMELS